VTWDDGVYVIHKSNKLAAEGHTQTLLLAHDPNREQDHYICNLSRPDGSVCRMPRHHDGDHIPFSGEHISVTGVHVVAVRAKEAP
jgi:hypothetical protein